MAEMLISSSGGTWQGRLGMLQRFFEEKMKCWRNRQLNSRLGFDEEKICAVAV